MDRLLLMGHDVIVIDNFFTGSKTSLSSWIGHPSFDLVRHDVVNAILLEVDQVSELLEVYRRKVKELLGFLTRFLVC